ncbi:MULTISPECIES: LysR family transcriptional regulator [unclassified Mameliella]|uniref:LysR family transcriptional regulator n=1 Tax=unclassified Mameliella TaxID=2630630 RepID=UPI00273D8596|nr:MULTISPECIES: LysR family transcriptional regulator [unclassified Mameliella]
MTTGRTIPRNLRHLRLLPAIADHRSLTGAAQVSGLSQTAVTHALHKLETAVGSALFDRNSAGAFPTNRGLVLLARVRRALDRLDPALESLAPGLSRVATHSQLTALITTAQTGNVSLAARQLGLAQPTVHRAVTDLERAADRSLFDRARNGLVPHRACLSLCRAARLAFAELDQAEADLAEFDGREGGRVVLGALPLSRSDLLPAALVAFRQERPETPVIVHDSRYEDLLAGLVAGEVDAIIGALRSPAPAAEVEQRPLFEDRLCFVSGPEHPLAGETSLTIENLARWPWIVPREGAPARLQFQEFFAKHGLRPPENVIESGSVLLMRETLRQSDMLGCISGWQAAAEVRHRLMTPLPVQPDVPARKIGVTLRRDWMPTTAQRRMLDLLTEAARNL